MTKLFISHASADIGLVKPFVQLLESGVGISPTDIFCTSLKGQGIKPGTDFVDSIRNSLGDATLVLSLISENYYNSPFSMCELGGAWLLVKDFFPVLVPPVRFKDMKAVLSGLQASKIDDPSGLDELRDELAERLDIKPLPTPRWNEKRDEFLSSLPSALEELPLSPTVPRRKLKDALAKFQEANALYKEQKEENETLRNRIEKLKATKDAKSVADVEMEELDADGQFDQLVAAASKSLEALDPITREAIYTQSIGQDYYPGGQNSLYSWDEVESSLQYKEIELNDEGCVRPNSDHPRVAEAVAALDKLRIWIESESPEEFYQWYISEYKGFKPDLTDRHFWDAHLL